MNGFAPIFQALSGVRFPLQDEKALQAAMADRFTAVGIEFQREVTLEPGDIVDFMIGDVALEVKIKGQRRAIYRQCERYAGHATVGRLMLATNIAMALPPLHGKPTALFALGRAWL